MATTTASKTSKTRKTVKASNVVTTVNGVEVNPTPVKLAGSRRSKVLEGHRKTVAEATVKHVASVREYTLALVGVAHAMVNLQGFTVEEAAEVVGKAKDNVRRFAWAGWVGSLGIDGLDAYEALQDLAQGGLTVTELKTAQALETYAERVAAVKGSRKTRKTSTDRSEAKQTRKAHGKGLDQTEKPADTVKGRTTADIEALGAIVKRALDGATDIEEIEAALHAALAQIIK